ncbi:MAG: RDD family protein [Steroidobacteraceae bacterium]
MMTTPFAKSGYLSALLALSLTFALSAQAAGRQTAAGASSSSPAAQQAANAADDAGSSAPDAATDNDASNDDAGNWDTTRHQWRRWGNQPRFHQNTDDVVSVGHDATLAAGQTKDSVVAVFGSATSNGMARHDVVSVFGDTTVSGPASGDAVAVLGNVTVNSDIGHDVVAVLGDVNLGPAAHVHGHVVSVLGAVNQDPAAIVEQGVERVLPEGFATAQGLRTWIGHGLLMGRPLVFGTGLQWLWVICSVFLAVYIILALLFRDAADHCIATLHENPGKSFITAILAVLLTPLMFVLLAITVVGILVIPIAAVTLFCAAVFGKTTVLGWIGNRCFGVRPGHAPPHPALAVLVGGLIVMLAYLVPILGFVVFILLGMLGYGAVLYALLNRVRHTSTRGGVTDGAGPAAPAAATPEAAPEPQVTAAAFAAAPSESAPLPLTTLPRATFWVRMGALCIDTIIIWSVIRLLLSWPQEGSTRLCILALAAYGAVMWKVKGTTIGGIALDLRVVRLDSRPVDWPTACVRALGCILSLCALGLGFLWIGIDPGKQAWHDKLAGTIVVRVPKGTPLV